MLLLECRLKYEIISLIRGRRLLVHSEGVGRQFILTDNIESGTELIIIITRAAAEEEQPTSRNYTRQTAPPLLVCVGR